MRYNLILMDKKTESVSNQVRANDLQKTIFRPTKMNSESEHCPAERQEPNFVYIPVKKQQRSYSSGENR